MYSNRSFVYALPMLDWWTKDFITNQQFRGCFIGDIWHPDLDNHILLLYKFDGSKWYTTFEQELKESPMYVDSYEPDKNYTLFIFTVPEEYRYEMDMFKSSRFSLFTNNFKKRVVNYHGKERTKNIVAVMYRHESAYLEMENYINKGLPKSLWTKIPRDIEAARVIDTNEEYFNSKVLATITDSENKVLK